MVRDAEIRSQRTRIVLLAVVLILAPGIVLGYLGFRSIASRAESLRTNYVATIVLVRDRLEAEVDLLESEVVGAAEALVATPRSTAEMATWLQTRATASEWLAQPFFLHRNGGVITAELSSGWPQMLDDPLEVNPGLAGLVRQAEGAEFAEGDLEHAVRLYSEASEAATSPAQRCLALTRAGRALFKSGRFREGISSYREVLDLEADVIGTTGVPCAVIALSQMGEGFARLGEPAERKKAQRELLERLVEAPWDLQRGYAFYLSRALDAIEEHPALGLQATAISEAAGKAEWIRSEIGPRLRLAVEPGIDAAPSHAHILASWGDVPVQFGYRLFVAGGNDDGIAAFGYEIRSDYVSGVLLPRLLGSVELGADLGLGIVDERGRWRGDATDSPAIDGRPDADGLPMVAALAEAGLERALPGWKIVLVDRTGRSITQIVARENRVYGTLMVALVVVLAAGVAFTARAASREVELSRLRSDFVANVTHELKTPLALIRMYGETLESGLVDNEVERQEFFAIIRRESERLTHLINNVLDFGKIDSGAKEYSLAREDIVAVVRESVAAYRYFFDRLGAEVETDLPDEPIYLPLDREAIAQSLVNLLHNALKYGGDGKYVRVSVRVEDGEVMVSVADRGVGIPEDELALIFNKYHRVEDDGSEKTSGSGLGLAIVKHAVEGHNGRVEVQSMAGRGSTFTLRLPIGEGRT